MAEPLSPEEFARRLAAIGVSLPPEEVEEIRKVQPKIAEMLELLRSPSPTLTAEPAFTFAVGAAE
ncbi:hypothetical protein [Roseococcus sp. YIM B11640]|uniref:hypothetical protein n=1 Tax=Roseococcus sp. YIM B11640 TaxID=3133973 RepID=UPI003C7BFCD7